MQKSLCEEPTHGSKQNKIYSSVLNILTLLTIHYFRNHKFYNRRVFVSGSSPFTIKSSFLIALLYVKTCQVEIMFIHS